MEIKEVEGMLNDELKSNPDEISQSPLANTTCITEEMYQEELKRINEFKYYTEILHYQNDIKDQMNEISSVKDIVQQCLSMENTFDDADESGILGNMVSLADLEAKANINREDMQKFLDNYDQTYDYLTKAFMAAAEKAKEFDDTPKTSTFFNNEALHILNRKLGAANKSDSPNKKLITNITNLQALYTNRDSIEYIMKKLDSYKIQLRNTYKSLTNKNNKKMVKSIINNIKKNVQCEFGEVFEDQNLLDFEDYLKNNLGDMKTEYDIFLMSYAMYLIRIHSKKNMMFRWVDAVIINALDIKSGKYDLPKGEGYYILQIEKFHKKVIQLAMSR